MAFENVNVVKAKSAINNLISELNYKKSQEIVSKYSGSKNFQCGAKDNFMSAINTLHNQKYKPLENQLKKYKNVIDTIEKYKKMDEESKAISSQLKSKEIEYNKLNNNDIKYKSMNQGDMPEAVQNRNKMNKLKGDISNLKSKATTSSADMKKLENQIKGSL